MWWKVKEVRQQLSERQQETRRSRGQDRQAGKMIRVDLMKHAVVHGFKLSLVRER